MVAENSVPAHKYMAYLCPRIVTPHLAKNTLARALSHRTGVCKFFGPHICFQTTAPNDGMSVMPPYPPKQEGFWKRVEEAPLDAGTDLAHENLLNLVAKR